MLLMKLNLSLSNTDVNSKKILSFLLSVLDATSLLGYKAISNVIFKNFEVGQKLEHFTTIEANGC